MRTQSRKAMGSPESMLPSSTKGRSVGTGPELPVKVVRRRQADKWSWVGGICRSRGWDKIREGVDRNLTPEV